MTILIVNRKLAMDLVSCLLSEVDDSCAPAQSAIPTSSPCSNPDALNNPLCVFLTVKVFFCKGKGRSEGHCPEKGHSVTVFLFYITWCPLSSLGLTLNVNRNINTAEVWERTVVAFKWLGFERPTVAPWMSSPISIPINVWNITKGACQGFFS